jgi:Zn-dependent protease
MTTASIFQWILNAIAVLFTISIHEYAHGQMADWLGDDTARRSGRLSLNPIHHIDPVGALCMLFLRFGWAKPVPINPSLFTHRKRDTILVSLAGPLVNLGLATILLLGLKVYFPTNTFSLDTILFLIYVNLGLGFFNLLPLPPLDGSKILMSLLPTKMEFWMYRNQRYLYIFLLIAIMTNAISKVMGPLVMGYMNLIY